MSVEEIGFQSLEASGFDSLGVFAMYEVVPSWLVAIDVVVVMMHSN